MREIIIVAHQVEVHPPTPTTIDKESQYSLTRVRLALIDLALLCMIFALLVGCATQLERLTPNAGGSVIRRVQQSSTGSTCTTRLGATRRFDSHDSDSTSSSIARRRLLETSSVGPFSSDSDRTASLSRWSTEFSRLHDSHPTPIAAFTSFLGLAIQKKSIYARPIESTRFVVAAIDYEGGAGDQQLLMMIRHAFHLLNGEPSSEDAREGWSLVLFHTSETVDFWMTSLDIRPGGAGQHIRLQRVQKLTRAQRNALPHSRAFLETLAPAEYILLLDRDSLMTRSDILPSSVTRSDTIPDLVGMAERWVYTSAPWSWCTSTWCSLGGSNGASLRHRLTLLSIISEIRCGDWICWWHAGFGDVKDSVSRTGDLVGDIDVRFIMSGEHDLLRINCGNGEKIKILDTSYGQGQGMVDYSTGGIAKGFCHASIPQIPAECDGRQQCGVTLHLPDPCFMVYKQIVVSYTCLGDTSAGSSGGVVVDGAARRPAEPQDSWFAQVLHHSRARLGTGLLPKSEEAAQFALEAKDFQQVEVPYFLQNAWSLPRDRLVSLMSQVKQYYPETW